MVNHLNFAICPLPFEIALWLLHSELPIPRLEMRGLAEVGSAALDPVRDPVNHLLDRHGRVTEKAKTARRVIEQGGWRFLSFQNRLFAEDLAELLGHGSNRERLRPGQVQDEGRRLAMRKASHARRN